MTPDPKNYNRHPASQVEGIVKSIRAQGWQKPIVVDTRTGYIVTGHGEHMAAMSAGFAQVPVDYRYFATDAARRAWLVADNEHARRSEVDDDALRELCDEIGAAGIELEVVGVSLDLPEDTGPVREVPAPTLSDGDRAPFRQATFTLHDEQWEQVEAAISKAKGQGHGESAVNENSNGNALAWIAEVFNRG